MTAETLEQFTFKHYQEKEQDLLKAKKEIISKLPVGTMLFKGGAVYPERYKIVKQENDYTEVKCYVWDSESFLGYAEVEGAAHRLDIKGVLGYLENENAKFFTENPMKPLNVVEDLHLRERLAKTDNKERIGLLLYGTFFNIVDFGKFKTKPILSDDINYYKVYKKKVPKIYGQIGYWDMKFTSNSFSENNYQWKIDFFGQKMQLEEEVMEQSVNGFVKRLLAIDKENLNKLNEFELLSYYTLNGFQVQRNYLTMETSFKKPFSTKRMFIEIDELYNFDMLLGKWELFSKVDGEYKAPMERAKYQQVSVKRKYAVPGAQLKAFSIPKGSLYVFDKKYSEQLSGNLCYEVLRDDGKIVSLQAVEQPNVYTKALKPIENTGVVKAPRKIVTYVKLPEQFGDDSKQELIDIPFAVPVNQQITSQQIFVNQESYTTYLTREEQIQMQIYEKYAFDKRVIETLLENDLIALKSVLDDIKRCTGNIDRRNVTGLNDYTLYKEFVNMYCAIQNGNADDMTLPELMLAYRMKGKQIRYCGHPTHFIIDEKEVVHSTKHDIFTY